MSESWYQSIFGIAYPGFEKGWSCTLDLGGNWVEMMSGASKWVPYTPADGSLDSMAFKGIIRCRATVARAIEGAIPPYGIGTGGITMPVISDSVAIPGVTGILTSSGKIAYTDFVPKSFGSKGQTGIVTDDYSYELSGIVPFDSTVSYVAQPGFIAKKFGTHEWKDNSSSAVGSVSSAGIRSITYGTKRHGRIITGKIQLDKLSALEATALVNYIRYIRGNYFASTTQSFGPAAGAYGDSPSIVSYGVCTKLTVTRDSGLYFKAEMTCVLHTSSVSGPPVIWNVQPNYISNLASSTTITINGAGLYTSTTPVVTLSLGGTSYNTTAVSATNGQVVVTAPNLPNAGNYVVTLTRDGLTATAPLTVYSPSSIILSTGAAPVATALVNISKNSLIGLTSSGAVLADSTTGVVAVGYAKDTVTAGSDVTIYQTGEATPVSGFTEGQTVYLGANGNYVAAPPAGFMFRQEVGTATASGIAVLCKEAVWA